MNILKKLFVTSLATLAFASVSYGQIMKNVLTIQQQDMAIIACLEAKGDLANLSKAIDKGLDDGLSVNQVKKLFLSFTPIPDSPVL